MLKPYSTKQPLPVPVEYDREFVEHGHDHCKKLFGKRAAQRYFTIRGPTRLRAERDAWLAAQRVPTLEAFVAASLRERPA